MEALKDPNIAFKVKNSSFKGVSIAIAAITTIYSRIYINRIKNIILEKKSKIYYFNTNNKVTDIKLKLEHKIKKCYFINTKTYYLVLNNEYITKNKDLIIKAKEVKKNTLNINDFIAMYGSINVVTAIKIASITDCSKNRIEIPIQIF